jgi:protein-disulfide isomerase
MNQIMDEYGINGKLAWVYRQLPIGELHPNSPKISEAALCVGEIGREKTGKNDAFWTFTNLVFDERDFDAPTNVTKLPEYAEIAGVSRAEYTDCMDNGRMKERLTLDIEDAFRADAKGTPYTVLILGNQQAVISGAQPYEVVKGIVQNLIEQLDGTFDPSTVETTTEVPTNQRGVPILE